MCSSAHIRNGLVGHALLPGLHDDVPSIGSADGSACFSSACSPQDALKLPKVVLSVVLSAWHCPVLPGMSDRSTDHGFPIWTHAMQVPRPVSGVTAHPVLQ